MTAYELRISDWSSDVCSSDLQPGFARFGIDAKKPASMGLPMPGGHQKCPPPVHASDGAARRIAHQEQFFSRRIRCESGRCQVRSEEHTSELQSLMRISYAVFCLKKKKCKTLPHNH